MRTKIALTAEELVEAVRNYASEHKSTDIVGEPLKICVSYRSERGNLHQHDWELTSPQHLIEVVWSEDKG
jgi:hypothetical protein